MSRALPEKVRAGDKLSAKWLNSVIDYLKYVDDQQLRRRILKGVGYAVSESPGGSSLTIDRQAIVRVLSDDLDVLHGEEFEVRIKPKGLCKVDKETGNWDKIVQVHTGRITTHVGFTLDVVAKEQKEGEKPSEDTQQGSAWDAESWVDMETLPSLGKGDSGGDESSDTDSSDDNDDDKDEIEVFVKMRVSGGVPTEAVFTTKPDEKAADAVYIPIGKVKGELVEGSPRYYVTQYHRGPIELGGDASPMPFDVTLSIKIPEPQEGEASGEDKEEEPQTCINVAGGRVFLPQREYVIIPDKNEWSIDVFEGYPMYVTLTLSRNSQGNVAYKYALEGLASFGSEIPATEEQEDTP